MRCLSVSVVFLASTASAAYGQCASMDKTSSPGITPAILPESTTLEPTDPLIVHVRLKNSSKGTVSVMDRFAERDFEAHVQDSKGAEAPLTGYGEKIRMSRYRDTTMHLISLLPEHEIAADEDVRRVYRLDSPGTYSVYVCHIINKVGSVYSNKIEIVLKAH